MKTLASILVVVVAGCGSGGGTPVTGDDDASVDAPPPNPDADLACTAPTSMDVSGVISANATWSGTVHITAATTIAKGITVTVMPGTVIDFVVDAQISISLGSLFDLQGTSACHVVLRAATPGEFWNGVILNGGNYTAHYLAQTGGGVHVSGGKATIVDSTLSTVAGDLLTMRGGEVDVSFSSIGLASGTDSTHCDMHFAGTAGNTIKVTHTNISTSAYALMFYNGINADLTHNNWFLNSIDIDTQPAPPVTGDVSFGFFAKKAPTNAGLTVTNLATAKLTDAGPRP